MFSLDNIITPLLYIYSLCQLLLVSIVHLRKEAKWLDTILWCIWRLKRLYRVSLWMVYEELCSQCVGTC